MMPLKIAFLSVHIIYKKCIAPSMFGKIMPNSNYDGQTNQLLGYPNDARLLIVNADDFGMCHTINTGIFRVTCDPSTPRKPRYNLRCTSNCYLRNGKLWLGFAYIQRKSSLYD